MTLMYERRGDTVTVKCSIDGKVLAVINEDTAKGWDIVDCSHYKWERISVPCYYDSEVEPDICQPDFVERLKQKQLLRIDDGEYFYLLVPKGEEE